MIQDSGLPGRQPDKITKRDRSTGVQETYVCMYMLYLLSGSQCHSTNNCLMPPFDTNISAALLPKKAEKASHSEPSVSTLRMVRPLSLWPRSAMVCSIDLSSHGSELLWDSCGSPKPIKDGKGWGGKVYESKKICSILKYRTLRLRQEHCTVDVLVAVVEAVVEAEVV